MTFDKHAIMKINISDPFVFISKDQQFCLEPFLCVVTVTVDNA